MDYPFNLKRYFLYFPRINTEYDFIRGELSSLQTSRYYIANNIKEVIPGIPDRMVSMT